ncbi:hypothetical protein [Pararhodobacter oceanensis]|uniref:Uncharacterized protein n=1 Tax=Pararhodobacter oceanensis TaxID=2172121 RepID=A0A2T8HPC2_9RHOB|nr:hypothetical protein [Pararhodobacter oceanensis]PVH27294.1 hypothetical protein DDE20_18350 [Pararhodobacter oceanensis]
MRKSNLTLRSASGIAIGFGVLTLLSGASALFGALDMGAVVGFVLWFNTVAGVAYIAAGVGLWWAKPWAYPVSLAIFVSSVLVFAGFGFVVLSGGAFEMRTVFAMALRSTVWLGIALVARAALVKRSPS